MRTTEDGEKENRSDLPNVGDFDDYRTFLKEVFARNSQKHYFSHRYVARQLDFSVSYLADIIANRKELTIHRALKLADFFGFDVFDTEYWIMLVFKDSPQQRVREYFQGRLGARRGYDESRMYKGEADLFSHVENLAIVSCADGLMLTKAPDIIAEKLYTFPHVTSKHVGMIIQKLLDAGSLRLEGNKIFKNHSVFIQKEHLPEGPEYIHRQYAENFLRYCDNRVGPATMNSGFCRIPIDNYDDVQSKLIGVREWLRTLASRADQRFKSKGKQRLYQFDINLFPVAD